MWDIQLYRSSRGIEPVTQFISTLQTQAKAKLIHKIDLLEEFGPDLDMPHSKQLEQNLYELRIRGRQEIRIFYCFVRSKVYLLHGFVKKTQRTPSKELSIARRRQNELI